MLYDFDDDGKANYSLLEIIQRMIAIPLLTGQPPDRWLVASSVCLEKEQNNPQTDKIRIIHLYEADLNLVWKLLWGSRLVHMAEDRHLYPDAQYGSRPGRNAPDAVLCKQLCYEISRISKSNMALLDNDAIANFDRIVCSLSSIACQRLGMPAIIEQLHNEILLRMRYNIKTGYGTSEATYGGNLDSPMQGQGQGSGNAPSCWGALSTPMWVALRELCDHSFRAISADNSISCDLQGIAFVDDATNLLNDIGRKPMDEATLINALQTLAQMWERLVYSSGGALKPSKCFWFAITWHWASGFPIIRSKNKYTHPLTIRNSPSNTDVTLQMKGPSEAERTLGIRISPSGSQVKEIEWLRNKAESFAEHIKRGHLNREEAHRAYHSIYIPGLTYSLGITCLNRKEATSVQKRAIGPILASMGVNRNMHRAVVYGPTGYGGLGFKCLSTEQGIQQIEHLVGHLRLCTTIGKLITIALSLHQLTAGISRPLLEFPDIKIPYLDKGWFTSIRDFLSAVNGSVHIPNQFALTKARNNDRVLMDCINDDTLPTATLQRINHCRLYLQVITLSDICTNDGLHIIPDAYHGQPISDSSSTWQWPRQVCPPATSWALWQKMLRNYFLTSGRGLALRADSRLGAWLPKALTHHRQSHLRVDTTSGCLWQTLQNGGFQRYPAKDIALEPGRHRVSRVRPLPAPVAAIPAGLSLQPATTLIVTSTTHVLQTAIPVTINNAVGQTPQSPATFPLLLATLDAWEARLLHNTKETSNLRPVLGTIPTTLACDSSVVGANGTFGWVLGTDTNTYWEGSGPVDGSPLCMSSQRAELTGILSGLRLILHFTKFHNITRGAPVTVVCDNRSAVGYATPSKSPTSAIHANAPDYDLTRAIHDTITTIPLEIKLRWVRGHQDSTKPFESLPREAQLNIIADELATEYHQSPDPERPSKPNVTPSPTCAAYLLLRGHVITSNHKQHLRRASLLPALSDYTVDRNTWHHDTWHCIDWTSHSRALHSLQTSPRLTITKFLHRWLPTNHNLRKETPTLSPTCSLCELAHETDNHLCQCTNKDAESIRSHALSSLRDSLSMCGTDPVLQNILLSGLCSWFSTGNDHFSPPIPHDHPFSSQLSQAVTEQNSISWRQLCQGRLSLAWGECYLAWKAHDFHMPPGTKRLDPTTWTTRFIKWAFATILSLWRNRNHVIHQRSEDNLVTARHLRAQARARECHSRKPADLSRGDLLAYFSEELPLLLLRPPHVLEAWVAHVDRIYIRHRNELLQRTESGRLTHFFARISHRSTHQNTSPNP